MRPAAGNGSVNAEARHASTAALSTRAGTVLAFDFGTRRIGVAVGESLLGSVRALIVIDREDNAARFAAIGRLIDEWQPVRLVVGLPRALDGSEHEMTARSRRFAGQLEERFRLPVVLVDERLTSSEADALLAEQGIPWRERKKQIDAVAAQLILQDHFDAQEIDDNPSLPHQPS